MQISKSISEILDSIGVSISTPNYDLQILIAASVLVLSFVISKYIRSKFPLLKEPLSSTAPVSKKWLMRRSGRILNPIIAIIFLTICEKISVYFFGDSVIISATQKAVIIWFLWIAFNVFTTSTLLRIAYLWILVPAALLKLFGWFDFVVKELESYGFMIGQIDINIYTVIKALFFLSLLVWIGQFISGAAEIRIRGNKSINRSTRELLIKLFDIFLYATLFLISLNLIGINLTALAVFGGALGVGIGFGLQKIASNFISGIILLSEKSININNLIEMDNGVSGYLRKFGARASIIETLDGKEVMIPNEDFITSRVANLTFSSNRGRIDIPVGVAYATDLNLAHNLILGAATSYAHALQDEEFKPDCFLREYGDSSVNFLLTFWLADVTKGRWRAQSDVMFVIWNKFKEHNIEIPFPQRDLHIRSGLPTESK